MDDDGLLLVVAQLVLMPRPPTIHRSVTPATSLASSARAQAYVSGPTNLLCVNSILQALELIIPVHNTPR